jgi:MOSC domain-containing protein YiiM
MPRAAIIDSQSVGDPRLFRDLAELERRFAAAPAAPADRGSVALIVRRMDGGVRDTPARVRLSSDDGVPGDKWALVKKKADAQISVMQRDVAELIANTQPLGLFGDNLFLDLDLSAENLPAGSRLRAGAALLVVTAEPHTGCRKFQARFGPDALRFVSTPALRDRNLRGIYMRVVEEGEVACGDSVVVVARG